MRLEAVARGRGVRAKAKLTMIRLFSGAPAVDVVKTLEYRPAFFGTPFNAIIQEVMRGPWSGASASASCSRRSSPNATDVSSERELTARSRRRASEPKRRLRSSRIGRRRPSTPGSMRRSISSRP